MVSSMIGMSTGTTRVFSSKTSTLVTESKSSPAEEEKQSSIEVNLLMGGAKHHYIIHKVGISEEFSPEHFVLNSLVIYPKAWDGR